jgi:Fe-S cluster assembly protein SufD
MNQTQSQPLPQPTSRKKVFRIDKSTKHSISNVGTYLFEITKPGVELVVSGVFDLKGKNRAEVAVIIHHQAPHTRAETTLKGVVRDQASLTFIGRIVIDENCGNSHSFLTERVLLLSATAHAKAVPDLEIKTDDVSCSHAASVSDIPEDHIFYLMSRGLSRRQAVEMVVEGFLS